MCPDPNLADVIRRAAAFLPSQSPLSAFVHHNTLHVLEDSDFETAVLQGGRIYGCEPYMSETRYQREIQSGRIRLATIDAVLMEDLADRSDGLVASLGTRYALRRAMLHHPLRTAPALELRWLMAESDALDRFREDIDQVRRRRMMAQTRQWLIDEVQGAHTGAAADSCDRLPERRKFIAEHLESMSERHRFTHESTDQSLDEWESMVLRFLWATCRHGVRQTTQVQTPDAKKAPGRHRDHVLAATGIDSDDWVHDVLIRFCSTYVDQGFATWESPDGDDGLLAAFSRVYGQPLAARPPWMKSLAPELREICRGGVDPLAMISDTLDSLGVEADQRFDFIRQTLLSIRGWAGMLWQIEFNAPWTPRPAIPGTFHEFLALKLRLDFHGVAHLARTELDSIAPAELRDRYPLECDSVRTIDQRAFTIFQLAQSRFWNPEQLLAMCPLQWTQLIAEVEEFGSLERRRILHLAYEREYRNQVLDAVAAHVASDTRPVDSRRPTRDDAPPSFQIACCIDDREESFRRHLEECDPACETFGVAGFFGVSMYYRGESDAHYTPLCPVNITPEHFVREEPAYSLSAYGRRQALQRQRIGRATHHVHLGTRTILGGLLAGIFGSVAAFPLVARILFPRTTAKMRTIFGSMVQPAVTQLRLERIDPTPSDRDGGLGYDVTEMADIVQGGLRMLGLTRRFSPLVIICGHGSASLNNPHAAAYNCGACGGGRGGPNARAFAQMANDPRVRRTLADRDLPIPETVVFVGGYHNTCDDSMVWYDLDRLPATHRRQFEKAREAIYAARQRNAHERTRRFESADLECTADSAISHVEGRSEDLSQTRPECGHATNAVCFVGRRDWSRGLFLDRRAFLTSYDPELDDVESSILEGLLQAVIPVCAGINLEYYFSYVDPVGYGSGTKLPHNITSLLGVMDGASSDLRTGLPWQMVEIHEPVRLLFVVETDPKTIQRIIATHAPIRRLVDGGWVQLATLDPKTGAIDTYKTGHFQPYKPAGIEIPTVTTSRDWYQASRDHLPPATVTTGRFPSRDLDPSSGIDQTGTAATVSPAVSIGNHEAAR